MLVEFSSSDRTVALEDDVCLLLHIEPRREPQVLGALDAVLLLRRRRCKLAAAALFAPALLEAAGK